MDRRGRFFEGNNITKEFGLGNVRYARGRSNPGVLNDLHVYCGHCADAHVSLCALKVVHDSLIVLTT